MELAIVRRRPPTRGRRRRHPTTRSSAAPSRLSRERWREQPSLERIAAHVGMKPLSLQRLFTRWAGLTPKGFLQAVTLDHARALLDQSASVLDASYEVGLSGPGRLHDLFVTHDAMTPGAYKARGEGIVIRYGFHPSPFGTALVMVTEHGLAGLAFADPGEEAAALADMKARWPRATYVEDAARDRAVCPPHLRPGGVAARPAAPHRHDRLGLRAARLGDAAQAAARQRHHLLGHRRPHRQPEAARAVGAAVGEPDLVRRSLPPRARQGRQPHRLPLGPDAQAGNSRLGGGGGRTI